MAVGPDTAEAVRAFNRFGLGARPGELALAAGDPRGYLLEELWTTNVALIRDRAPLSGAMALQAFYLDQQQLRVARMKAAARPMTQTAAATPVALSATPLGAVPPSGPSTPAASSALAMAPLEPKLAGGPSIAAIGPALPQSRSAQEMKPARPEPPKPSVEQALFRAEAQARLLRQLAARAGFVERLIAFWSNHFAVSVAKSGELPVAAGPFEREAIRPNALGKFAALLRAADSHPAMILYLDNQNSIGPDALPGKFAGRGLNENLAREILELHTLGVGSGYTQADVTELARILTGWSVAGPESEAGQPGAFLFKPNWHEPGTRKLLGKTYAEAGVEQGRAALDDLARHPSTARHIATKLARHFVADDPPADLVAALAKKFLDSDGDLALVASALVSDDRAWAAKPTKMRTPLEFVLAAARATGFQPNDPGLYLQSLNLLGMPLWQPGGPNGFSDMSEAWSSAEGLKARLDLAAFMGSRMRRSRRRSARPLRPKRSRRSSAPNRASRRSRSCSWRRNSSGGEGHARKIRPCARRARRAFVGATGAVGAGVLCGAGFLAQPASAASARDPRLIVVILRGALDGLSAIPPVGDPDYADLHGDLAFAASGDRAALPLDGFFFAHPALAAFKRLYDKKEAAVVHAVATGYRDRSHFDGQDVLESGYPGPGRTESGWLNRTLGALPPPERAHGRGLAVGAVAPLVIRGAAPSFGWAPPGGVAPASADLAQRVLGLYAHADPALGERLNEALMAEKVAAEAPAAESAAKGPRAAGPAEAMRAVAAGAARLLAAADGPRIAALAYDGFDTHFNEGAAQGVLAPRLQGLDAAFEAFETNLGEAWKDTFVVAITEFGRTVRVNGAHGTDHGTATVALLAGGAVAGGRVIADWPGLKPEKLYQGRDLYPTADLRAVLKGLLAGPFGLSAKALAETVFPESAAVAPMKGLVV